MIFKKNKLITITNVDNTISKANFRKNILYSIFSGILLVLAFPPLSFFLLAFLAFIPIFQVLNNYNKTTHTYLYIYIMFFIYHIGTNWWISSWQENTDIYLFWAGIATAFFHPLFFLIPFFIYFQLNKLLHRRYTIWVFPLIWVTFEWLHSIGDLAYSWLTIGYTQFYNYNLYQVVDIAGIWGVSFLVILGNVLLYKIFINCKDIFIKGENNIKIFLKNRYNQKLIIIFILIIILPNIYGLCIIKKYNNYIPKISNKSITIGLIQPNINPWKKWETNPYEQLQLHLKLQDSLFNDFGTIDLFIWNETAIPATSLLINRDMNFTYIKNYLYRLDASLLTGFAQYKFFKETDINIPVTARYYDNDSSELFCSYNSAILLNRYIKNTQIYHKQRLTPFAEGIPYVKYLKFMKDLFVWGVGISSWERGTEIKNFILPLKNKSNILDTTTIAIAPIICIESIYPGYVRKFVDIGAEILTVITNDAWYDYTSGPIQHYIIAVTRAMENRRYLARCANTGISGIISPLGIDIVRAYQYKTMAVAASVPALNFKTIYTKYGDYLPQVFIVFILIFYFSLCIFKLKK